MTACRLFICASVFLIAAPAAAQISGEVTYTGTESGRIVIDAFTESDEAFEKLSQSLINPGAFTFDAVSDGTYTVIGYIDVNDDGQLGGEEPWVAAAAPIVVPPGSSAVTLDLDSYVTPSDAPTDTDDGCCAVVGADRPTGGLLALLIGLLFWRRRTF